MSSLYDLDYDDNDRMSRHDLQKMQMNRLEIFKSQDVEKGKFDVTFELEGKQLYAHQFILTSVSETMDSWLSSRWTTKDEVIKIESYSYDNFYQFLCFLYIAKCDLTRENIFQIVDMAEFYGVQYLKNSCDRFLAFLNNITVENIEEMYDFAVQYSLIGFKKAIKNYLIENNLAIIENVNFLSFKKSFVQFFATTVNGKCREEILVAVYNWSEHEILKRMAAHDDGFKKAVRVEVRSILGKIHFSKMTFQFLMNFVLHNGFILSRKQFGWLFLNLRKRYKDTENSLKNVYDLAEKQAIQKQKMSSDPDNFNVANSIKAYLAQVIPHVKFYKVGKQFVMDSLVAHEIISAEEVRNFYSTRVEIKNGDKLFTGVFIDEHGIRYAFEKLEPTNVYIRNYDAAVIDHRFYTRAGTKNKLRFYSLKFPIPSISSSIQKMVGCEWYLCLEKDGILTLKHHTRLEKSDYIISEMTSSGDDEINPGANSRITFSDNV